MEEATRNIAKMWLGEFDNRISYLMTSLKTWEQLPLDFKREIMVDVPLLLADSVCKVEILLNNLMLTEDDVKYFIGVAKELEDVCRLIQEYMFYDITPHIADLKEVLLMAEEKMQ